MSPFAFSRATDLTATWESLQIDQMLVLPRNTLWLRSGPQRISNWRSGSPAVEEVWFCQHTANVGLRNPPRLLEEAFANVPKCDSTRFATRPAFRRFPYKNRTAGCVLAPKIVFVVSHCCFRCFGCPTSVFELIFSLLVFRLCVCSALYNLCV